jgi:hypothetical protein
MNHAVPALGGALCAFTMIFALPGCFSSSAGPSDSGANFDVSLGDAFGDDGMTGGDASASDTSTGSDAPSAADGGSPDARGDANANSDASAEAGGAAAPGIYVTNAGNTVTVFALGATGNVAPIRTISGASTQLNLPIGIRVDGKGNLLVANRQGGNVTVYPDTASGNVAPTSVLTATGMGSPQGIAIGASNDVYVSTCPNCGASNGGNSSIFHFPSASGESDSSFSSAGLAYPSSIALDGSGNLWVGNSFGGDVELFAAGSGGPDGGTATPTATFTPGGVSNLQSMAFGAGTLLLTDPTSGVLLFPASSTGSATASSTFPSSTTLPITYPAGVFFDGTTSPPTVYLVDYGASAVDVIATAGTAPNLTVMSVTTIAGSATGLSSPLDIHVVH